MPFFNSGNLKLYRFSCYEDQGLYHAVFTRHGGLSPVPWSSLNFGASVGDDIARVTKNREIALNSMNLDPKSVFDLYQVHSTSIVSTERALLPNEIHQKADAIITDQPNITLMMRFADCVPILLFDPVRRAIGLVHAGWVGTVEKIARNTILRMIEIFGTNPHDLVAAIGPSIGPDHYIVGNDVLERVKSSFGNDADKFIINKQSNTFFDLWKANQKILMDEGVNKIEISEICTCCNPGDWYSHRGEHGKTGRFGVVFGLYR